MTFTLNCGIAGMPPWTPGLFDIQQDVSHVDDGEDKPKTKYSIVTKPRPKTRKQISYSECNFSTHWTYQYRGADNMFPKGYALAINISATAILAVLWLSLLTSVMYEKAPVRKVAPPPKKAAIDVSM